MSVESRYRMSQERLEELKKELEYLQTVREKEVSEQIKEARSFGDLSEGSEYDEAKRPSRASSIQDRRDQNLIEKRRHSRKHCRPAARSPWAADILRELRCFGLKGIEVYLSQEANPILGRISDESPLGRSLMGKKKGDRIEFEAPGGVIYYEILNCEN